MVRLLSAIVNHQDFNKNAISPPLQVHHDPHSQYPPTTVAQGKNRGSKRHKLKTKRKQREQEMEKPSNVVFHQQYHSGPLKEGLVEKKGHVAGWLLWPRLGRRLWIHGIYWET